MKLISPYVFAGLPYGSQNKFNNNYFSRKVRKSKQVFANRTGVKKPFYEHKLDRLMAAFEMITCRSKYEIFEYNKEREIADIRNIVISVACRFQLGSQKDMAKYFNRKDHSTIHAANLVGHNLIRQDADLKDLYNKLVYSLS